jgi:phage tail-like protein
MAAGEDPFVGITFALEIDGVNIASFRECSGIESEIETVESKESDKKGVMVIRKIPGAHKLAPITLKRGATSDMALYEWHQKALSAQLQGGLRTGFLGSARKTASIILYDVQGAEKARYNLVEAWCSKYKGGELNATSNNVVVEEITIVHEGMVRIK